MRTEKQNDERKELIDVRENPAFAVCVRVEDVLPYTAVIIDNSFIDLQYCTYIMARHDTTAAS